MLKKNRIILCIISCISVTHQLTIPVNAGDLQHDLEDAGTNVSQSEIFSGFTYTMYQLNQVIEILFPVAFIILFFYTFINAPLKKRRGVGVNALCALIGVFFVWTFMPTLAGIVSDSSGLDAYNVFLMWTNAGILVPIAAAMSTILGIALSIASSPFQKYRGAGLGIIGFSALLWAAWIIAPAVIKAV